MLAGLGGRTHLTIDLLSDIPDVARSTQSSSRGWLGIAYYLTQSVLHYLPTKPESSVDRLPSQTISYSL